MQLLANDSATDLEPLPDAIAKVATGLGQAQQFGAAGGRRDAIHVKVSSGAFADDDEAVQPRWR
jgi:hypothetical protein